MIITINKNRTCIFLIILLFSGISRTDSSAGTAHYHVLKENSEIILEILKNLNLSESTVMLSQQEQSEKKYFIELRTRESKIEDAIKAFTLAQKRAVVKYFLSPGIQNR